MCLKNAHLYFRSPSCNWLIPGSRANVHQPPPRRGQSPNRSTCLILTPARKTANRRRRPLGHPLINRQCQIGAADGGVCARWTNPSTASALINRLISSDFALIGLLLCFPSPPVGRGGRDLPPKGEERVGFRKPIAAENVLIGCPCEERRS